MGGIRVQGKGNWEGLKDRFYSLLSFSQAWLRLCSCGPSHFLFLPNLPRSEWPWPSLVSAVLFHLLFFHGHFLGCPGGPAIWNEAWPAWNSDLVISELVIIWNSAFLNQLIIHINCGRRLGLVKNPTSQDLSQSGNLEWVIVLESAQSWSGVVNR